MKFINGLLGCLLFFAGLSSCTKNSFLDKKPNTSIIVPTTLAELRALLDNTNVFTYSPGLGEVSSDNYYMGFPEWQALSAIEHNTYSWEKDLFGAARQLNDWTLPCQQVLYTNIVLEQLEKMEPPAASLTEWRDLKGSALFLRAFAFSSLVQHFAPGFDSVTAASDPGIPVRLSPDIHLIYPRASVADSYAQIFADLAAAAPLLSENLPATARNRPSRPAVFALCSRLYLATRQYIPAGKYADSCLTLYNKLINYNTVSPASVTPFDKSNDENLYFAQATANLNVLLTTSNTVFADTLLYQSYAANDLRKSIFFRTITGNNMGFKRGYAGNVLAFTGLATDEVYLNRAESYARAGNTTAAMNDLNGLLSKRWKTGTYNPLSASSSADALAKVLAERRKELVWRGLRWADLKRLNKEGAAITLTRQLNGQVYTLAPNSPRYVLPIPADEIGLSGNAQNPR
ncbi:MAG: hypothetical protein JWQ78_978 [Sediminibacterium sp.]|nr:hypothetical protein [Sediminibacterium sp.]